MAASSMGARENTVKKAMDAPKLMARRSAHQPSKAAFKRRQKSARSRASLLCGGASG